MRSMSIALPVKLLLHDDDRVRTSHRVLTALGAMGALLVVYGAWQISRWTPASRPVIGDVFFYPVSVAAVWTSWRAAGRCRGWPKVRRAWLFFAAAAGAYLIGDIAQTIFEFLGAEPSPSLGRRLLSELLPPDARRHPLLPCASPEHGRARPRGPRSRGRRTRGLGGRRLCRSRADRLLGAENLAQAAASVAYPVGDMVLLVGLGSLLLHGSAPSSRRALQLVGVGLTFYVVADLAFGYVSLHAGYKGGDPLDTLWMVAIAVMAIAATFQAHIPAPEQIEARTEGISWLPYTAIAFGLSVLMFSDRHDPLFPGLTMTMIAMLLVGLVCVRQFLAQRDLLGVQGQLRHLGLHDALTELPNRLLVTDRAAHLLTRTRRTAQPVAALLIDLDGFKHVNDTLRSRRRRRAAAGRRRTARRGRARRRHGRAARRRRVRRALDRAARAVAAALSRSASLDGAPRSRSALGADAEP